jgi:hypothetical protein
MVTETKKAGDTHHFEEWAQRTSLFRNWEDMKREVLLHKWYESEKAGHDIGWERAMVDWLARYGRKRN